MRKFNKIYEDSIIPVRATVNSAAYDLYAQHDATINPNETVLIKTGVNVQLENDEFLAVCSRSGLAFKNNIFVLNAPGIVDSDYFPNEIGVLLHNTGKEAFNINKGDRIAQGIIQKYSTVEEDNAQGIRTNGFGSTGK